jgi:hypothetical protein
MVNNIFKHNSRSYYDIYNALITAYPNKPTWMFEEMSGLFDFQSELMNRIATDILYPSTREAAYGFASRCDYEPVEADGSIDTITITLTGAMSKTIAAGYQFGGISPTTGEMVIFETTTSASSGGTDTITASVKQQKTVSDILIGIVNNADDFADYPIDGYTKIIKSSITLTIGGLTWTRVDNFDFSESTDRHFKIIYQSSGKCRIQFGNGTTGLKPTIGDAIYGNFSTTLGLVGVLSAGEIEINVGNDNDIQSLTNAGSTGGNDAESVASILRNSRANARLRTIVWSKEDLETAARASSSSVQKALGIPGIGTASIQVIPTGGGNPSAGLKTTVQTYVQSLTQFGLVPITAVDPSYVTANITATATIRADFDPTTVLNLVRFALTLITSSYDNQVVEYYDDNGIDACRTAVINVLWAWAFTEDENEALEFIIERWKLLLGSRSYREWGQDLEVGNIWIMADSLYDYGVDVFSLTSPTSNISTSSDEIIETGAITVS